MSELLGDARPLAIAAAVLAALALVPGLPRALAFLLLRHRLGLTAWLLMRSRGHTQPALRLPAPDSHRHARG